MKSLEKQRGLLKSRRNVLKKELKVMLYRTKYFPGNDKYRKDQLIKDLVYKEKRNLGLMQLDEFTLLSEDEYDITKETIKHIVEEKKMNIFNTKNDSESFLHDKAQTSSKENKSQNGKFPVIPKHKFNEYLRLLKVPQQISEYERGLNRCLTRVNSQKIVKPYWMSPSCILMAINHGFLHRKWNNLAQLVLMLMHFPQNRHAGIIRHICQIMSRLHPGVQARGLQDQFQMIYQVHKKNP